MADNTAQKPQLPAAVNGDPGYGLGVAGFIVSFFVSIAGIIMSAIALKQSKAAGKRNGLAFAGLIIGIVKAALEILVIVAVISIGVVIANYCTSHESECSTHSQYQTEQDSGNTNQPSQTY